MKKKKYTVTLKTEILYDKQIVQPEGASCIEFIREGDYDVMIAGAIPLNDNRRDWAFINKEYVEIRENILVDFTGTGTMKKVIVIKSIYEPVNV